MRVLGYTVLSCILLSVLATPTTPSARTLGPKPQEVPKIRKMISDIGNAEKTLEMQRNRLESLAEQKRRDEYGRVDWRDFQHTGDVKDRILEMVRKAEQKTAEIWKETMDTIEELGTALGQVSEAGNNLAKDLGLQHTPYHMKPEDLNLYHMDCRGKVYYDENGYPRVQCEDVRNRGLEHVNGQFAPTVFDPIWNDRRRETWGLVNGGINPIISDSDFNKPKEPKPVYNPYLGGSPPFVYDPNFPYRG